MSLTGDGIFGFVDDQKFLVLWESVSKARAFIHIRSNLDITITEVLVRNWIKMVGLYSSTSSFRCYLKCDAEPSLSALLEKCGIAVIEKSEQVLDNPLTFSTASGEHMQIDREVQVRCQLEVHRNNRVVRQVVVLRVLVADVQHNLSSTSQMIAGSRSAHRIL